MKQKIISVLVLLIAQLPASQSAQAFPDRPVKLVVPSPAGGPPDIMARLLSDKMGAALGQPGDRREPARRSRGHDRR
jgi:tripartite-type tricarboxylate transporter receptor subunit TctC